MSTIHEQTVFSCMRNGKEVKIECDKGIVPLIKELNEAGFATCYSCEGDDKKDAYVVVKNPRRKNLHIADEIVRKYYWHSKRRVTVEINLEGAIVFRAWNREQFEKRFMKYNDAKSECKCIVVKK